MRAGVAVLCLLAACGDNGGTPTDAAVGDTTMSDAPIDANPLMPATLRETGLCDDGPCAVINAGILAFTPQYTLYSDGATKRRWISVPAGMKIDTTDMNFWKFPVGTKVWKEFTRDGVRVETRFGMKVAADDSQNTSWYWASYLWDAGTTTTTLFDAAVGNPDALGTMHDVPSRNDCRNCHQKTPNRVLGFNAMSLDYDNPDGVDLKELVAMDLLTTAPTAPLTPGDPFFPLGGTAADKAAYGFFHANCGHCHNAQSPVMAIVNVSLRMDTTKLAPHDMPAYTSLVNQTAQLSGVPGTLVIPGNATDSVVMKRMSTLNVNQKMPQIGTETLNDDGIAAVTAWISQPP